MGSRRRHNELEMVYHSLFDKPQTMKEVDKGLGVMRESVCWYCRTLRKAGKLFRVKQRRCTITGYPNVWELTTDPNKALNLDNSKGSNEQLNLFKGGING